MKTTPQILHEEEVARREETIKRLKELRKLI